MATIKMEARLKLKDYIKDIEKAERRYVTRPITFAEIEENGAKKQDDNILEGYAAVFNSDSENFGGWVEQIAPGAFTGVMDDNAFALVNHSMDQVLGRNNVNVKLSQDDIGLKFSIKLPDTTLARDTKELVRSNILNKCSFAFIVQDESFVQGENGAPDKRIINKMAELFDVSIVTVPAYPDTSVASRSFRKSEGMKQIQRSLQEYKLPYLYHKNKLRTNKFKTNARS